MNQKKAIILCRISDIKQDDGYSLKAQERLATEYCNQNKLEILKVYSFTETASKSSKRTKFAKFLNELTTVSLKQKYPVQLIVEKPDRLSRNFTSKEQIQLLVTSGKLVVHYYKDKKIFDKDCSPSDIFYDDIQTAVSKYAALNISRESKKE